MKNIREILQRIDWVNTLFLIITPVIAFWGVYHLVQKDMIHGATVALAVVMAALTGIAITGGYHRLFAHKSYEANSWFKFLLLAFGAAAFQNSARKWSSDHRNHHKFVDTPQDPYNIQQGFWWAHIGWVMLFYEGDHKYDNVSDLEMDSLVLWQEKYYVPLGIAFGFILPTAMAALWGDPWGGLFIAGFLRMVLNHHFTFSINSFCHMIGSRPYSDRDSSRDNWFLALVTYGEGYHNYHHKFPTDYRNGIRAYHWDPTKWLIKFLSYFKQTQNLRQMPVERIVAARLKMDEKHLLQKMEKAQHRHEVTTEFVNKARVRLEESFERFRQLKAERLEKLSHVSDVIEKRKQELAIAAQNVRQHAAEWAELCRTFGVRATTYRLNPSLD